MRLTGLSKGIECLFKFSLYKIANFSVSVNLFNFKMHRQLEELFLTAFIGRKCNMKDNLINHQNILIVDLKSFLFHSAEVSQSII
jgi:hypothetical protein